ncbi:MAG: serine/threonine protein kinase, partial [Gammaproteobacteria bacterium]|nr:serine/threonine protein kinase [Gammaproteobacteria bacterium]
MSEAAAARKGQTLRTRYQLRERIGAGGQGEVWRAFDPQANREVALKILQPGPGRSAAAWAALVHEYESTARLEHPGVLKMFPPERDGTTFLLPMELAAGGDARRLRGAGYLTIVPVLMEVARALEHAHERGVIHRDLKPGNVLFDARGRVLVGDFGISGSSLDPGTDAMLRGLSPFTASPEQLRGEPPRPADDIYGLGALAYELLSNHPPHFPHFDAQRVQTEPAPPLVPAQQIPPHLAALVARMLAKDPAQRPRSMREVIEELETSLNDTLSFDFETGEAQPEELPAVSVSEPPAAPLPEPPAMPAPEPLAAPLPLEQAAANEPLLAVPPRPAHELDGPALWQELGPVRLPDPARVEPMRASGARVLFVLALLASLAAAAWLWQPQFLPRLEGLLGLNPTVQRTLPPLSPVADAQAQARWQSGHILLEQRLGALTARGAERWGGQDFSAARARADESVGAHDAGSLPLAQERLGEAEELVERVTAAAPAALAAQLAMGESALESRQSDEALQAFSLALQIDPENERARAGAARAHEQLN